MTTENKQHKVIGVKVLPDEKGRSLFVQSLVTGNFLVAEFILGREIKIKNHPFDKNNESGASTFFDSLPGKLFIRTKRA